MDWNGSTPKIKYPLVRVYLRDGTIAVGQIDTFCWDHNGSWRDILEYHEVVDVVHPNGALREYWWLPEFTLTK